MKTDDAYVAQIKDMMRKARAWMKAHPKAEPKIQFNYPEIVMLVATFEDAIENHYISVNPEGRELMEAMCKGIEEKKRPTAFMFRVAFEMIEKHTTKKGKNDNPRRYNQ